MPTLQLFQAELQRLSGGGCLRSRFGLLGSRLRWGFVATLWGLVGVMVLLGLLCRHGRGVETKPLDGFEGRRMDACVLHPGNEIQDVASVFALAETVPDVLTDAHAELCRVAAFVNRTRPIQAVSASFEPVEQTVMLQHFLHCEGRFDGLEVNKR